MNYPFAIFAPTIGARSETFIRRHIEELLPGQTVALVGTDLQPGEGQWSVKCPTLVLDQCPIRLRRRMLFTLFQKLGWQGPDELAPVRRFLKRHGARVILGEFMHKSLPWLDMAKEMGMRFFVHAHGYDVSSSLRDPRWRARYLKYNDADGVITMSSASKRSLVELGIHEHKIHAIPYGVSVPDHPRERPERDIIRCLAVGRMVAKKGPILALDAFRRASEACPDLRLDYVGAGVLFGAALQFIQAFALQDRITLHGGQSGEVVQNLMREADIFIQHSMTDPETGDEEGLPVAILEAMAGALPVVSTRHAGIPEAVLDGTTGFLVAEGDSSEMGRRILMLARDGNLRRNLGAAAWRRARERFDWSREREDLLKVMGLWSE